MGFRLTAPTNPTKRLYLIFINKINWLGQIEDVSVDRVKSKESEKKSVNLPAPCPRTEKVWNKKLRVVNIIGGALVKDPRRLIWSLGGLENKWRNETRQNPYSSAKIRKVTEKSCWIFKDNLCQSVSSDECSKLAQEEYKSRYDWVGKVIHWEMCRKFKLDHTNKWYMHNPAPVLENDTHKLIWEFDVQTGHLISARKPDLIIINNKKKREFAKLSTLLFRLTTE